MKETASLKGRCLGLPAVTCASTRVERAGLSLVCPRVGWPWAPSRLTPSDWHQLLCPGAPLQIEVKGHLNANIMA